jgi:hypothetical protein
MTDGNDINSTVGELLDSTYTGWDKIRLYSWHWGLGNNYQDPRQLYDLNKFNTTTINSSSLEHPSNNVSKIKIFDRKRRTLFSKKKDFVLELLIEGVTIGDTYHAVITNVCPDKRLFGRDMLHSEIGKWYCLR